MFHQTVVTKREKKKMRVALVGHIGVVKQRSKQEHSTLSSFDAGRTTPSLTKLRPLLTVVGWTMKKGIHPQMQWISYVTQSGRLMHVMMTRIHHVGKVYHFGAKRQLAQSIGQIAKFKRRFNEQEEEPSHDNNIDNQNK
ncbi:BnaA10g09370D [Brassica napus]|nr:unnamed protein product [Brassica napus]CDY17303.1 BnaA10g09370D [Brassica napus]